MKMRGSFFPLALFHTEGLQPSHAIWEAEAPQGCKAIGAHFGPQTICHIFDPLSPYGCNPFSMNPIKWPKTILEPLTIDSDIELGSAAGTVRHFLRLWLIETLKQNMYQALDTFLRMAFKQMVIANKPESYIMCEPYNVWRDQNASSFPKAQL